MNSPNPDHLFSGVQDEKNTVQSAQSSFGLNCDGGDDLDNSRLAEQNNAALFSTLATTGWALSDESLCFLDPVGQIVWLNAAAENTLGASAADLQGQLAHHFFSAGLLVACLSAGTDSQGHDDVFYRHDGSAFRAEWKATAIMLDAEWQGVLVLFRDITRTLKLEKALQEHEARFERSFNDPAIGKAMASVKGTFLNVNPYLCRMLGYEREALLNRSFLELTHPDDIGLSRDAMAEMLSGKVDSVHFNKRYLHRNGDTLNLSLSCSVVRNPVGEPMYFLAHLQDVTSLSDAQTALWESRERFRRAFDDSAIGMAIVSLEQTYINLNPYFCDMLGYPLEELLARSAEMYTHPDDWELEARMIRQMTDGVVETCAYEKRYLHRNGQVVWGSIIASNVRDDHGKLLYFVRQVQDITERKRADEQLRQAREAAEIAATAKADFLAMMSHEIRTPMNAVLGMAGLLASTPLTSEQQDLVATIKNGGQTLMAMLNDILDFSKMESGKMELDPHPFSLRDCIEEVCALFRPRAVEKGLILKYELDERIPSLVLGDSQRLRQILVNLIGNAIKFTESGRIWVRVSLDGPASESELILNFAVQDTGCGIPADKLQVIFESFTQVEPATARHYGGTGLGLAICNRLVHLMQGQIQVESQPGEGSTFSFSIRVSRLPYAAEETLDFENGAFSCVLLAEQVPLRILVAEDNRVNQQLMLNYLNELGYQATMVSDGLAALQALETQPFDLIFMDVQMPVMDGLVTSRVINERYGSEKRPRIIAITAFSLQEDRQKCLVAGMDDYVTKPILLKQLEQLLRKWYDWLQNREAGSPDLQALPQKTWVQVNQLMARLGKFPEQMREMVEVFEEENEAILEQLAQGLSAGDTAMVLRQLHQLKGACLALCLSGAHQSIMAMEQRLKREQGVLTEGEWRQLQVELQTSLGELQKLVGVVCQ